MEPLGIIALVLATLFLSALFLARSHRHHLTAPTPPSHATE